MKLEQGRPLEMEGRQGKEQKTYEFLDSMGILYERVDHEPLMTMEDCREADELLGADICKNLFLCNAQRTDFYLLMLPAHKKFQAGKLSKQIGSARLSFAEETWMEKFLNLTPGSVSVMGLMYDTENQVKLLVDREVLEGNPRIGCHPCVNTSSISMTKKDLLERFLPAVGHDWTTVDL